MQARSLTRPRAQEGGLLLDPWAWLYDELKKYRDSYVVATRSFTVKNYCQYVPCNMTFHEGRRYLIHLLIPRRNPEHDEPINADTSRASWVITDAGIVDTFSCQQSPAQLAQLFDDGSFSELQRLTEDEISIRHAARDALLERNFEWSDRLRREGWARHRARQSSSSSVT